MVLLDGENGFTKSIKIKNQTGMARLQSIAEEVDRTLEKWEPEFVILEGYGHSRSVGAFVVVVECGTVVRLALHMRKIPWAEVPPKTLKRWTAGSGSADKKQMAKAAERRWGYESKNTDLVDAYALAKMAEVIGLEDLKKVPGVRFGS